jgi:carbamoyl-phosphate synthase large subunit
MNPRVPAPRRWPKATGFPIAVAAKLAVGYTLDELMNDITGGRTSASSSRPSTTWSQNPTL